MYKRPQMSRKFVKITYKQSYTISTSFFQQGARGHKWESERERVGDGTHNADINLVWAVTFVAAPGNLNVNVNRNANACGEAGQERQSALISDQYLPL